MNLSITVGTQEYVGCEQIFVGKSKNVVSVVCYFFDIMYNARYKLRII